jgi:hypothetical protein
VDRLVEHLDALCERHPAGEAPTQSFRFGARELMVELAGSDSVDLAPAGLFDHDPEWRPAHPSARSISLSAAEFAEIPLPRDVRMAAYGAILESVGTGWLIIHNPEARSLLALNTETRVALNFGGDRVAPRQRAEYCRPLLHWLAILDGNVVVHAGAVAHGGRGILIAGAGNAGKSTLTRALLREGFDFLGDNVVEVGPDPAGVPTLFGAYPTFKVRPGGVLPIPGDWPEPEWDSEAGKDIYFLGGGSRLVNNGSEALLAASLVLDERLIGGPRPISRGSAFFKVAPNTVAQFPFFEQEALARSGAALGFAPVFESGRIPLDSAGQWLEELMSACIDDVEVPRGH